MKPKSNENSLPIASGFSVPDVLVTGGTGRTQPVILARSFRGYRAHRNRNCTDKRRPLGISFQVRIRRPPSTHRIPAACRRARRTARTFRRRNRYRQCSSQARANSRNCLNPSTNTNTRQFEARRLAHHCTLRTRTIHNYQYTLPRVYRSSHYRKLRIAAEVPSTCLVGTYPCRRCRADTSTRHSCIRPPMPHPNRNPRRKWDRFLRRCLRRWIP